MKHYKIKTSKSEALRFLGYRGNEADEMVSGQLDEAIRLLQKISVPVYTYKVFELLHRQEPPSGTFAEEPAPDAPGSSMPQNAVSAGITLKGTSLRLSGKIALSFLKECHSCILMAVTIGRRVDAELRRRQITDMSGAVILDSCASSAVESVCNQLEADLEKEYGRRGLFLTDRFSPGYGDLPLDLQPDICRALSTEKTIGLSVTGGMLMMPTKSVTAFIGISDRPQPKRLTGCTHCRMNKTCNYRKAGVTCAG